MIHYESDPRILDIKETPNGNDSEFQIRILDPAYVQEMKAVQRRFEEDEHYAGVLFYVFPGHSYKMIVNQEHYAAFLAELWKRRMLRRLEWSN